MYLKGGERGDIFGFLNIFLLGKEGHSILFRKCMLQFRVKTIKKYESPETVCALKKLSVDDETNLIKFN